MKRKIDIKVSKNVDHKYQEIFLKSALDPLNIDRLTLNRLFHQKPDLPDKSNFK